jgi:hypothetical protein
MFNRATGRPRPVSPRAAGVALAAALLALAVAVPLAGAFPRDETTPQITIDDGTAPDGSAYRWIVYGGSFAYDVGGHVVKYRGYCSGLTFPGKPERVTSVGCAPSQGTPRFGDALVPFQSFGAKFLQARSEGVQPRDVLLSGTTDPRVHAVRIAYTDATGQRHDLPVDYVRFSGNRVQAASKRLRAAAKRRARKAGKDVRKASADVRPFGVYTAFVPGDWAARDRLAERELQLHPNNPPTPDDLGFLILQAEGDCTNGPTGPFELIAYDSHGQQLDNMPDEACRLGR